MKTAIKNHKKSPAEESSPKMLTEEQLAQVTAGSGGWNEKRESEAGNFSTDAYRETMPQ